MKATKPKLRGLCSGRREACWLCGGTSVFGARSCRVCGGKGCLLVFDTAPRRKT